MLVFVHGLWLTGVESAWLRRRLGRELGCETRSFHYLSVTAKPGAVIESLNSFVSGLKCDALHLVGHSLGGIVLLRLLEKYPQLPPGRVVLLGSPVAGSDVARFMARSRIGAAMIGRTAQAELLQKPSRHWDGQRDLGVIAGDHPYGLGRLMTPIEKPHDGTVTVAETELPGATDRIVLPVSHTGMLFSTAVARQTAQFLKHGHFAPKFSDRRGMRRTLRS